jgi:uncharacterized membrane protein (DUF2068 family)
VCGGADANAREIVGPVKMGYYGWGVDNYLGPPSTKSLTLMPNEQSTSHEIVHANEEGEHSGSTHDRGLLLIGLFKLAKAIFFFCIGVGAIHLLHKDLEDELLRLAVRLKFDPESKFVALLLDKVDLIDAHRLRQISVATFAYSALALTEGVGLLMEKVWAEYLTLILTISFLPWELYELARRPDWFRLSLLVINLGVLAYLVWLLRRKKLIGAK